jgi:hypothetical protein
MEQTNPYEYHLQLLNELGINKIFDICGFREPTINKQHISDSFQWANRNIHSMHKLPDYAPYDVCEIFANYQGDLDKVREVLEEKRVYESDGFVPEDYPIQLVFQISGSKDQVLERIINKSLGSLSESDQRCILTVYERGDVLNLPLRNDLFFEIKKGEEPKVIESENGGRYPYIPTIKRQEGLQERRWEIYEGVDGFRYTLELQDIKLIIDEISNAERYPEPEESTLTVHVPSIKLDDGTVLQLYYLRSLICNGERWVTDIILDMKEGEYASFISRVTNTIRNAVEKFNRGELSRIYWDKHEYLFEIAGEEDRQLKLAS